MCVPVCKTLDKGSELIKNYRARTPKMYIKACFYCFPFLNPYFPIDVNQTYALTNISTFDKSQNNVDFMLFAHTKYSLTLKKALSLHQKKKETG